MEFTKAQCEGVIPGVVPKGQKNGYISMYISETRSCTHLSWNFEGMDVYIIGLRLNKEKNE